MIHIQGMAGNALLDPGSKMEHEEQRFGAMLSSLGGAAIWHATALREIMRPGYNAIIVPMLAIAGSMIRKPSVTSGTVAMHGALFVTRFILTGLSITR